MEYVFVKHLYKNPVKFGKYGTVKPGQTLEVTNFDYKGSLERDPMWSLVETHNDIHENHVSKDSEEEKVITKDDVNNVKEKNSKSKYKFKKQQLS